MTEEELRKRLQDRRESDCIMTITRNGKPIMIDGKVVKEGE